MSLQIISELLRLRCPTLTFTSDLFSLQVKRGICCFGSSLISCANVVFMLSCSEQETDDLTRIPLT